jgi:hypothetical protein
MKSKSFFLIMGLSVSVILTAQEGLQVAVTLPQKAFVPGEPIAAHVVVTNTSQVGITFFAKLPKDGIRVTVRIADQSGQVRHCGCYSSGIIVPQGPGTTPPESTLAPGQSIAGDFPADLSYCPLTEFPPGRYSLRVDIVKTPQLESEPWLTLASRSEPIELIAPTGENAAYLGALQRAIEAADPKTLKGRTLKDRPFEWREVLHSNRVDCELTALSRFPTSTYAGYALAKKLIDLSDWRFKVASPASIVEQTKRQPGLARFAPEDVELFNLVEKYLQGGNVPTNLATELYCYYGGQLALRGRNVEAQAAFKEAVKIEPANPKGQAYYSRAKEFLKALDTQSEAQAPAPK